MKTYRLLAVLIAILATWMQFIVPVAMANARADVDPFSIVCSHRPTDTKDDPQPAHSKAEHDCCTLCHAQLWASAVGATPVFVKFDYPVASPLRWRLVAVPPIISARSRHHRPRGPPSLD